MNIGGGTAISDLTSSAAFIAQNPTTVDYLSSAGWPVENIADAYGGRILGLLVPPVSGSYTFAIRSDDASRLFLSTNDSSANKVMLTEETGCCNGFDAHVSGAVTLVAGQRYYIEALMKEGGGGDYLYVAWKTPLDPSNWVIIPGANLGESLNVAGSTLTVTKQPTNTSVISGQTATFSAAAIGTSTITTNISYQWQMNGLDIAGAITAAYTTPVLFETNGGAIYRVVISLPGKGQYSSNAVLTVLPDIMPPTVVQALNVGATNVQITFSEAVEAATATNAANYVFTNGVAVLKATLSGNSLTVTLTTGPLVYGSNYTILVSGVRDVALTPNTIAPNTPVNIFATEYAPLDIGSSTPAGGAAASAGGYSVTGGGADLGGTTDQFLFDYQLRSGNFDIKVRLDSFGQSHALAKAGLMARANLNANSSYAAVFATPSVAGSSFQSRSSAGAGSASSGNLPVNYPYTWLRLQRVGAVFTGYTSYDGLTWAQLGTATIAMTDPIYFGMAVSSHETNKTTTAQFRELTDTGTAVIGVLPTLPNEPLGPSSRKSGLAITEIMYHPSTRLDGRNLEFVEIFNSNPFFEDISGHKISGNINYTFPPGTLLASGAYLVIAKVPADIQAVYGISNVTGPYTGSLPNNVGTVRVLNKISSVLLEVNYGSTPPWPVAADGTGHSLILARPTYGEDSALAWAASDLDRKSVV